MNRLASRLPAMVEQQQKEILAEWLQHQQSQLRLARRPHSGIAGARGIAALPRGAQPALQQASQFDARSAQWGAVREFL